MKKNRVKQLLHSGKPALGSWVQIGHPDVAEIMANMGFDWLVLDNEHGPLSTETTQLLIQAMSSTETVPIVRVPWNDMVEIKRALDIGAYGVVIPWVNSKEEALYAVRACKYPPAGLRGVGPRRASRYGIDIKEYLQRADDEILIIIQIETQQAVDHIDEILSVEGIDAFFIGPYDLSASLGYLGQPNHPKALETFYRLLDAAKSAGVASGIHALNLELAQHYIGKGFQFVALSTDTGLLIHGCQEILEGVRKFRS